MEDPVFLSLDLLTSHVWRSKHLTSVKQRYVAKRNQCHLYGNVRYRRKRARCLAYGNVRYRVQQAKCRATALAYYYDHVSKLREGFKKHHEKMRSFRLQKMKEGYRTNTMIRDRILLTKKNYDAKSRTQRLAHMTRQYDLDAATHCEKMKKRYWTIWRERRRMQRIVASDKIVVNKQRRNMPSYERNVCLLEFQKFLPTPGKNRSIKLVKKFRANYNLYFRKCLENWKLHLVVRLSRSKMIFVNFWKYASENIFLRSKNRLFKKIIGCDFSGEL